MKKVEPGSAGIIPSEEIKVEINESKEAGEEAKKIADESRNEAVKMIS